MARQGSDLILNGEVILSGYVVNDADAQWMGESGYICPQEVREALASMSGPAVLRINSPGGDPMAGEAIRAVIAAHPGGVTMIVEGVAASAASLIFMGAGKRQMTAGALLMIHDPSTFVFGTEAELLKQAEVTGKIADTYAAVYAAAAGITPEAAREIMREEVWYSPADAIAAGFAHEIVTEAAPASMSMEAARASLLTMRQGMTAMVSRKNVAAQGAAPATAAAGGSPAAMAITPKEALMPDPITTPAAAAATPEAILAAERARVAEIRAMAAPFVASGVLPQAEVDAALDDGTAAAAAGQRFMTSMAAGQPQIQRAVITRDETDTRRTGMQAALVAQLTGAAPAAGPAQAYMGMSIVEMAAASAGYRGPLRTAGDRINALMAGTHSTSDFSGIFENALNKSLLDRYQAATPTYRKLARKRNFNDFRVHPMVRPGDFPNLQPVGEGGEIKMGTFGEKRETAILSPYAVGLNISRQMMINDEMNAIADVINDYGTRVALFEEATFYAFMASATLASDGLAVWLAAATRANLTSTGTAITVASLGIGKAAMRKQTGIDGAKINLTPSVLLVSPDKETEAQQLVASITPATAATVNPFSGKLEVVTSAELTGNGWYLFADPNTSGGQCFVYGYLNGSEAPRLRTEEPFGVQGWSMTLEHDFGLGAVDFRGTYKNNGA